MANKTIIAIAAAIALTLPVAVPTYADTPPEVICWQDNEVAKPVIIDTIGTVLIGTRQDGQRAVKTYTAKAGSFEFAGLMGLLEETLPLSSNNCMRAPAWGYFAGGRYPVVGLDGNYVQVVVDPVEDKRVWLDRRELQRDFYVEYELFQSTMTESLASR